MSKLEAISWQAAEGIDGAAVLPGGGLSFERRGFPARVEFSPRMEVLIDTRGLTQEAVRVSPLGFWGEVRAMIRDRPFLVGDAEFDRSFKVETSTPLFAEEILQPGLRSVFLSLLLHGEFIWRLSAAGFMLRVNKLPESRFDMDRWMVGAFQVLDAIPGVMEAVKALHDAEWEKKTERHKVQLQGVKTTLDADTSCPICGTPLSEGQVVSCVKCTTPHHDECWEFNGRCSMFACGETAFRT